MKDGVLETETDVLPGGVEGRYLRFQSGALEWSEGTTTGGGSGTDNYCTNFTIGTDGILNIARTNGNLTVDLKDSFYTKGAANLNQALAIASAVLPNSVAIANLQTTCTNLQGAIDALTATLNESIAARGVLEARVTVLENNYATQSDVSALQSRCGELETWADALDGVPWPW